MGECESYVSMATKRPEQFESSHDLEHSSTRIASRTIQARLRPKIVFWSLQPSSETCVLEDASGLYGWLWEVAADIQTLAQSMRHPRMIIVGLATGDVAVGPYGLATEDGCETGDAGNDADESHLNALERVDDRDEGEEVGLANNGTRTVTDAEVRFRRIDERWVVDSIDYR